MNTTNATNIYTDNDIYTNTNKNKKVLALKHLMPLALLCPSLAFNSYAATAQDMDTCLLAALKSAKSDATMAQIRQQCEQQQMQEVQKIVQPGAISSRIRAERQTAFDPYVITPHNMNYILPMSVTDDINKAAYSELGDWPENLDDTEAKFQISIKVPLNYSSLITDGDGIYFGLTLQSWWQLYSDNISKPFRETNYQPEFFYLTPLNWHPFDGNTGLSLGIEHQSNGRSQLLSRSWNRVYANFLFEKNNFALAFKPWWRIEEDEKDFEFDSDGDDNPDIDDYMGHFELSLAYKWRKYELSFKGRENFAEHHGGLELGFTFPLWGKLRGYLQYTDGYGESLIDYNHNQQRFGLGIALTNVL